MRDPPPGLRPRGLLSLEALEPRYCLDVSITGVTRVEPPAAGALQVAIDFTGPLVPVSAEDVRLYALATADGPGLPLRSAVYSEAGGQSRVTLTVPEGVAVPEGDYELR